MYINGFQPFFTPTLMCCFNNGPTAALAGSISKTVSPRWLQMVFYLRLSQNTKIEWPSKKETTKHY